MMQHASPVSRLAIVDLGVGNFGSLINAFQRIDNRLELVRTQDSATIDTCDAIVMPGVGAFKAAVRTLRETGLENALRRNIVEAGKPCLGICLGLQVLVEESEEYGHCDGLGFLPGRVGLLGIRDHTWLPHVGWNTLLRTAAPSKLLNRVGDRSDFYFDHSYALLATDDEAVVATCDYGISFVAAVEKANIMGVQFHPEISGAAGEAVLRNFLGASQC